MGKIRQVNQSGKMVNIDKTLIFTVNSVDGGSKPFQTCELLLAGTPVTLVMSIGVTISILSELVYRKHFKAYLYKPDKTMVCSNQSTRHIGFQILFCCTTEIR